MIKTLIKSPKFIIGFLIIFILLSFTLIYPLINLGDPFEMSGRGFQKPSEEYILGTDNFGRDVVLQLAYATKTSLFVGGLAGIIAITVGLTIGLLGGYLGGVIDEILTFITNVFTIVPSFVILILISVSVETRGAWLTAVE